MKGIVNKDNSNKLDKGALVADGTDLNTIVYTGFYRVGANATNRPTGGANYSQMIVSSMGDTIVQIYCNQSDGKIFARTGYGIKTTTPGPHWGSWYQLTMTAV